MKFLQILQYLLGLHPWAAQETASNFWNVLTSSEGSSLDPPDPMSDFSPLLAVVGYSL